MLKIGNLKSGDVVMVNDEGITREGTVVKINHEQNQALVNNGIQEFWYSPDDMTAVPLDESQLMKFGFTKEEENGAVKYKLDSFRLVTPKKEIFQILKCGGEKINVILDLLWGFMNCRICTSI